MNDSQTLYFNGINGWTGNYSIPPLTYEQLSNIIQEEPTDKKYKNWFKNKHQKLTTPSFGIPEWIQRDVNNLNKTGWSIVFHEQEDEAVKKALEPLIEHRRKQIDNDKKDKIIKILDYKKDEEIAEWLVRHEMTAGNFDAEKVPYYILLIGSPVQIPFLFGYLLDGEYAVGRLHFDKVEGYKKYVSSLIEYETQSSLNNSKKVTFFAPRHPFDDATQLSADQLVKPFADNTLSGGLPNIQDLGFATEQYSSNDATKEQLKQIFESSQPPSLLFTASHGMDFSSPKTDEQKKRQLQDQGALLCQDWPAFGEMKPEHYFAARDLRDLRENAQLQGLITFHFACFGGGTPKNNRFIKYEQALGLNTETTLTEEPFFAALPKALLSGGALASIVHVERAWAFSFTYPNIGVQLTPFANLIWCILSGQSIGHGMKLFNEKYINLSAQLTSKLEDFLNNPVSDQELAQNWLERNDAESYIVFGDPAVRLRIDLLQTV